VKTDFSSPFMEATIIKNPGANEKRFSLSVNSNQANPSDLLAASLTGTTGGPKADDPLFTSTRSYLSSVTISMDLGGVPTIDVVLTPTLEDARKIIDSTLLEYPITAIEVVVGYSTGEQGATKTPPFQGILQPPEVNFGTDVTLTLKGVGTAGYYLAATAKTGVESRETRQKHIENLVAKLPEVTTSFADWTLDDASKSALREVVPLVNAGTSYLHLISQLARQAGCWVNTFDATDKKNGFRKLNLISQSAMMLRAPLDLLTLYDFGGVLTGSSSIANRGIYPILSVSVGEGLSAVFLSGYTKKLRTAKIDPTTHEVPEATAGPADATVAGRDGTQTGVKNASNDLSEVMAPQPDEDPANSETWAQQIAGMTSLSSSVGLQLDIDTLGLPDAQPGNMYEVRGLSLRIDGPYICHALKHSMSASGFTTSLTLIQNSQLMVQAILDKITPKVKNENPPIPDAPGTESQLQNPDGVVVVPTVEGAP
jgi:hypothetical protein